MLPSFHTAWLLSRHASPIASSGPAPAPLALTSQPNHPANPLPQLEHEEQRLQAWAAELAEGYRHSALRAADRGAASSRLDLL